VNPWGISYLEKGCTVIEGKQQGVKRRKIITEPKVRIDTDQN
jgi:hypothetical protein